MKKAVCEVKTYCDKCQNEMKETDNIFEDSNGDYICQDCFESRNEQYYNLVFKQ